MFDYSKAVNPIVAVQKPSGIRKYFGLAATMKDAISLGVGEPDFTTPERILKAGVNSILEGHTHYTANYGLIELRQEINAYLGRRFGLEYDPEEEILVTTGGSEAIDLCLRALLCPGDEIILPQPAFVCYEPLANILGAKCVTIATRKEDSFKLTPEALKAAITPRTKMLVLSFPNNPTGAILTREELEALAKVLEGTNIVVVSDEIYAELTYGREHVSFASIPGMRERTILVSGFSKSFAMTGWRLGYLCAPREFTVHLGRIHQFAMMSAPTAPQYAALEGLRHCYDDVLYMREKYNERREFMYKNLIRLGFDCFEPEGAFYIFPDVSMYGKDGGDFVENLLKAQKLALVPGDAFGECGKNHVRISYAYSVEALKAAIERMERYVESLR